MTIAACLLTQEGVVFGADSTTTMFVGQTARFYNYAQKLFEVGENSTLGMITWGLGGLPGLSYRTMIAEFADDGIGNPFASMTDAANRWAQKFWDEYRTCHATEIKIISQLSAKQNRTAEETKLLQFMTEILSVGFCLGGYVTTNRRAEALEMDFTPILPGAPAPQPVMIDTPVFRGCPNVINRVLYGIDFALADAILKSGKWSGTRDELAALTVPFLLQPPRNLPIREAADYIHSAILTTIKGMKFSHLNPVCGGPIELAVITTDRRFRWIKHKTLGEACESRST